MISFAEYRFCTILVLVVGCCRCVRTILLFQFGVPGIDDICVYFCEIISRARVVEPFVIG